MRPLNEDIKRKYLKLVITILRQLLVSQNPRRHREFSIAAEGMKEERPIAVLQYWRQAHSENTFGSPLKVQAPYVVIARQRIRHEVAVRYSPGRILLPWVHDQTVAEFVGHVREGVVAAAFSQIYRDVGDKSVLRGWTEGSWGVSNQLRIYKITRIECRNNYILDWCPATGACTASAAYPWSSRTRSRCKDRLARSFRQFLSFRYPTPTICRTYPREFWKYFAELQI